VDVVIGFQTGTLLTKAQPAFITQPEQAADLVQDGTCQNNLASYLTRRSGEERIGVICRGCENRAIHVLVSEFQYDRERITVLGVPCSGIIDWHKVERLGDLPPESASEAREVSEEDGDVVLVLGDGAHRFHRADVLDDACARCAHRQPADADVTSGEPVAAPAPAAAWAEVAAFEGLAPEERYARFAQEAERCIRCYACREACPTCYCTECFVDHNFPRWCESMITPGGTHAWHIVRAFHQAGRCVDCGACERACPMHIKMTYLTSKLNRDMQEQYDFDVGVSDEARPPFAAFALDDQNQFVR
jgi:ferredoxin